MVMNASVQDKTFAELASDEEIARTAQDRPSKPSGHGGDVSQAVSGIARQELGTWPRRPRKARTTPARSSSISDRV